MHKLQIRDSLLFKGLRDIDLDGRYVGSFLGPDAGVVERGGQIAKDVFGVTGFEVVLAKEEVTA